VKGGTLTKRGARAGHLALRDPFVHPMNYSTWVLWSLWHICNSTWRQCLTISSSHHLTTRALRTSMSGSMRRDKSADRRQSPPKDQRSRRSCRHERQGVTNSARINLTISPSHRLNQHAPNAIGVGIARYGAAHTGFNNTGAVHAHHAGTVHTARTGGVTQSSSRRNRSYSSQRGVDHMGLVVIGLAFAILAHTQLTSAIVSLIGHAFCDSVRRGDMSTGLPQRSSLLGSIGHRDPKNRQG